MQKARAPSDVEGYIYAFEILGIPPLLSTKAVSFSSILQLRAQIPLTRKRYI